jgi:hypothetical protein
MLVGSPQVDQHSGRGRVLVKPPATRERAASRSGLDPRRSLAATSRYISIGRLAQRRERFVVESLPNLGLPARVKTLDGSHEARLSRWSEDRYDLQSKTQSDHLPHDVWIEVGSSEPRVVVKLSVARKSYGLPVGDETIRNKAAGKGRMTGPRTYHSSAQGHGGEHIDVEATAEDQTFHPIPKVDFRLKSRHSWQVPSLRRRTTTDAATRIERSAPVQDPTDSANRGDLG